MTKVIQRGSSHRCRLPFIMRRRRFGVGGVVQCRCGTRYTLRESMGGFVYWSLG